MWVIILPTLLCLHQSSSTNLHSHRHSGTVTLDAIQCKQGEKELYANKQELCSPNTSQEKPNLEKVIILQEVEHLEKEAFRCELTESTIDELCGIWSYAKLAAFNVNRPVNISVEKCHQMVKHGYFRLQHGHEIFIDQNSEVQFSYVRQGELTMSSDNIRCKSGQTMLLQGQAVTGLIEMVSARLKLTKVPLMENTYYRTDLHSGLQLPRHCMETTGCVTNIGTYIFPDMGEPTGACLYQRIRSVNMLTYQEFRNKFLVNSDHHLIFRVGPKVGPPELMTKQKAQRLGACAKLEGSYYTQFDGIFILTNATNSSPELAAAMVLPEVDGSNYSPMIHQQMDNDYQLYYLEQLLQEQMAAQKERLCKLILQPEEHIFRSPFHKNSIVKVTGDLVSFRVCEPIEVILRLGPSEPPARCFAGFTMVEVYERGNQDAHYMYMHLETRLLFTKAPAYITEVVCNQTKQMYVAAKHRLQGMVSLYPYPVHDYNISANLIRSTDFIWDKSVPIELTLDSHDGLYTTNEYTNYHHEIVRKASADVAMRVITSTFCPSGEYCPQEAAEDTHPHITSWLQIIWSPLLGTAYKAVTVLRVFGEGTAICLGLYMVIRCLSTCCSRCKNRYFDTEEDPPRGRGHSTRTPDTSLEPLRTEY